MTSKKAYKILLSGPIGYTPNEYNEASNVIYKSLDQLEELKIENQDLKDNEKIITDYGYNLVIENEALKQGIATLTAKNNLLQEECDSIVDTNEILSKEIKYLKEQNQELVEKIKKYEREQYKQIR